MKQYKIIAATIALIGIIFLIYLKGSEYGKNKQQVKSQEQVIIKQKQEIKVKNEVVKKKEVTRKRIIKIKDTGFDDSFNWMWKNRCSDCGDNIYK